MNEFDLIAAIRARLAPAGDRVVVSSGDDAAVVRPAGEVSVTSIDCFVEGVHFRLTTTSLRDLGHKCLAAALSDLAAMGAGAGEAYIALGLPAHLGEREVLEFAEGAAALAAAHGVTICGGDLSRADELLVTVTVVGYARSAGDVVLREGALAGDLLGVTGALGGAGAGLLLLERKHPGLDPVAGERLLERHLRPQPLLSAGQTLAGAGVHAMLDVSDGVASDAVRLCERSGLHAEVTLADLPLDEGVAEVARDHGLDPFELAASAGEDYELLFAAAPEGREAIERAAASAHVSVTWIGRMLAPADSPEERVRLLDEAGQPRRLSGWDHRSPGGAGQRFPGRA